MQPCMSEISGALVALTVFDREVNVRRAASAAMQGLHCECASANG